MAVSPPLSSCGPPLLLQWAPLGGARRVWRHQPRIAAPPPPPLPAAAPAPARRPSAPPAERQRLQPLHLLRPPLQGAGQELQHQDKDRPNVFDLVRINMIQAKVKLGRQCGARIIKNIASINTTKLTSTINSKTNKSLPSPHQKQSPSSPLHPQGGGAQPPSAALTARLLLQRHAGRHAAGALHPQVLLLPAAAPHPVDGHHRPGQPQHLQPLHLPRLLLHGLGHGLQPPGQVHYLVNISHTYITITFNKIAIKKLVTFSSMPSSLFVEYFQFLY